MGWWTPRRVLPVFGDKDLSVRSAIHSDRCPARSSLDAPADDSVCRCVSATFTVRPGMAVRTLFVEGDSQLVQMNDSGPFWLEARVGKVRTKTPEPEAVFIPLRRRPLPPDYLELQRALQGGRLKMPRRRRPVKGGEICFIRSDPDQHPWRFFGIVFDGTTQHALLIDSILRYESALMPGWKQQTLVPLVRDGKKLAPEQVLIPVFPLPDGTKDPGWG